MVEFAYNNTMNSLTLQTPFFANHSLHPKFNIQGMYKIMNITTGDQAMWLANV
jgi:gluconate kinase